jgi:antirestriction protein ArdC
VAPATSFRDAESHAATLAHECRPWTKHEKGLARDFGRSRYGDEGYARQELIAELGSAFLCADLGITPDVREDRAAHIASWLIVPENEKRFIFTAAGHAQRAANHLRGPQPQATPKERPAAQAAPALPRIKDMSRPLYIEIDGRRYLWRDLVALRRAQLQRRIEKLAFFE